MKPAFLKFQLTLVFLPKTPKRCRGETRSLERLIGEGIFEVHFSFSCPKHHDYDYELFSTIFFQDGSRGSDVRDIEGPSVRFQGRHLVPRDHLNRTGPDRAPQPRDEPDESFAEDSEIGSPVSDAAIPLVSRAEEDFFCCCCFI